MDDKPWVKRYDPDVPATIEYPESTLVDTLKKAAFDYPKRACMIFKDHAISFERADELSDRLASALCQAGIRKGDRVGLLMPNLPQFVLAFYAILKAGGVVVAMNPQYQEREIEFLVRDSGLNVLISLRGSQALIEKVRQAVNIRLVIYTETEDAFLLSDPLYSAQKHIIEKSVPDVTTGLMDFLFNTQACSLPAISPDDPAIFQYSGGTTGVPKAAVGLHRNLVANTIQFSTWLSGLQEGHEVVLTAIPLFHVYGMVIAMSMGVMIGASLVLIPNPRDMHELLNSIQIYRATLFPGVPNMYHAINQYPDVLAWRYDLRSIKACISGSAPLRKETKDTFERLTGGKLLEGYGLSEAPTATHCNPLWGENRTGSIGLPLPDVECRIVDLEDSLKTLPAGQHGELLIRGPQVMAGYHNMIDESEVVLRDGWLHTGDIARMDADGYFYLVGRKKDLIKIGGFQVWPAEVEEVISMHPAVAESAVAGVEAGEKGEAVKAWVVLRTGAELTLEDLQTFCRQYMARYKVPTLLEMRTELPKTIVGKLLRRELIRQHNEVH